MRLSALVLGWLLPCCAALAEQPLPTYPGTVHTRIGSDLVIGGALYRLGYFKTADSPKRVARYFYASWKKRGLPTVLTGDFSPEGAVSAVYTREGLLRSVVLREHQGLTVGFVVLKDLWVRLPKMLKSPPLEGALFSQELAARDDPQGALSRTALLGAKLSAARDDLQRAMSEQGWVLVRESGEGKGGGRLLEHRRGPAQALTTLVAVAEGLTGVQQSFLLGEAAEERTP